MNSPGSHCGPEKPESGTSRFTLSHELGSEWASKQCKRISEWTSEWRGTFLPILGLSKPPCVAWKIVICCASVYSRWKEELTEKGDHRLRRTWRMKNFSKHRNGSTQCRIIMISVLFEMTTIFCSTSKSPYICPSVYFSILPSVCSSVASISGDNPSSTGA